MKFSREKLTKMIKEEYNRVQKEAEMAEKDPESPLKQLDWLAKSMKKIRSAIENEGQLDEKMTELVSTAAHLLDDVADALQFGALVKQHMNEEDT